MAFTLHEALRQIDPYVQLFDGRTVATVERRLMAVDPGDQTEFVIRVDSQRRLVLLELNRRGCAMYPPVLIEQKFPHATMEVRKAAPVKADFGFLTPGFA